MWDSVKQDLIDFAAESSQMGGRVHCDRHTLASAHNCQGNIIPNICRNSVENMSELMFRPGTNSTQPWSENLHPSIN